MRSALSARKHRRAGRLYSHHAHSRILLLQCFTHTAHRAASAYTSHKDIYGAIGIVPDLRTCGFIMNGRIGRIVELLRNEAAWRSSLQLLGLADGSLHALSTRRKHHLGTQCLQQVATFYAHSIGHGEDELITLHGRHESQAYTRISTGRLDDSGPWLQQATCLCILDHGQCHTIFHTTGRIEILQLRDELCFQAMQFLIIR